MKKTYFLGAALLVAGGGFLFLKPEVPVGEPVIVTMSDLEYSLTEIKIKRGQVVEFVSSGDADYWPASNIHPTHSIYPEFDPMEPVPRGETWSFRFNKVGEWRFHDHLHPQIRGVVIVE